MAKGPDGVRPFWFSWRRIFARVCHTEVDHQGRRYAQNHSVPCEMATPSTFMSRTLFATSRIRVGGNRIVWRLCGFGCIAFLLLSRTLLCLYFALRLDELEKQSGADAKELAEFSRLRRADASLPSQSLMHMAALSENGLEVRCRSPGVLQEELEPFGGGAIVRRECVPAIVVLDQQGQ